MPPKFLLSLSLTQCETTPFFRLHSSRAHHSLYVQKQLLVFYLFAQTHLNNSLLLLLLLRNALSYMTIEWSHSSGINCSVILPRRAASGASLIQCAKFYWTICCCSRICSCINMYGWKRELWFHARFSRPKRVACEMFMKRQTIEQMAISYPNGRFIHSSVAFVIVCLYNFGIICTGFSTCRSALITKSCNKTESHPHSPSICMPLTFSLSLSLSLTHPLSLYLLVRIFSSHLLTNRSDVRLDRRQQQNISNKTVCSSSKIVPARVRLTLPSPALHNRCH